jgi:hypothetical protein
MIRRVGVVDRMAVSEVGQLDRGGQRASTVMCREACHRCRSAEEHVTAVDDSVACGLAREVPWFPHVLASEEDVIAPMCLEAAWHAMCDDTLWHCRALSLLWSR